MYLEDIYSYGRIYSLEHVEGTTHSRNAVEKWASRMGRGLIKMGRRASCPYGCDHIMGVVTLRLKRPAPEQLHGLAEKRVGFCGILRWGSGQLGRFYSQLWGEGKGKTA